MRYLTDAEQGRPKKRRKSRQAVEARQRRLARKHEAARVERAKIGVVRSTIPDGVTILR